MSDNMYCFLDAKERIFYPISGLYLHLYIPREFAFYSLQHYILFKWKVSKNLRIDSNKNTFR